MGEKRRILITGAAGYIGNQLLRNLLGKEYIELILATDIKKPQIFEQSSKLRFVKMDIRSAEMGKLLKAEKIDTVVHLASIVTPGRKSDRQLEYEVDVLGTQNILQSCISSGVRQLIVTSSGAAYGYYPDSPEWLTEQNPIRGNEEFAYSYHKRLIEEMLTEFREKYPQLKQLIFRPGTVLGKTTNNQITALFHKPFILGVKGSATPFVFIWDQDVVNCLEKGIRESREGIFNLAGDGVVTMKEIAAIVNKPYIPIPAGILKTILWILKKIGLSQYGPEQVNFIRYRPVLSNKKLKEEFGYIPMKTSLETFQYYWDSNR